MLRVVVSELRHRRERTLALLLGIALATTSFTVLTGTSASQRLDVRGTVAKNYRGRYDALVRPRGARTALEQRRGLVRDNALSGVFGGITLAQWRRVRDTPGVEVAAPIANVGYALVGVDLRVPVPVQGRARQLYRVRTRWSSDRDTSGVGGGVHHTYVTPRPFVAPASGGTIAGPDPWLQFAPKERLAGGEVAPVCSTSGDSVDYMTGPWDPRTHGSTECWSLRSGGYRSFFDRVTDEPLPGPPSTYVRWTFPILIAAIDPEAEARLSGIDGALASGRYLRRRDRPSGGGFDRRVPVLASTRPFVDETLELAFERLRGAEGMTTATGTRATARFLRGRRGRVVARERIGADAAWSRVLRRLERPRGTPDAPLVDTYLTPAAPRLRDAGGGALTPEPVRNSKDAWASTQGGGIYAIAPMISRDRGFRATTAHQAGTQSENFGARLRSVGTFDPQQIPGFASRSTLTLEAFDEPGLRPADRQSSEALGGRALLPNGNIPGYPAAPPLILTNLRSLPVFGGTHYERNNGAAPISAIRVRVAGVTGIDAAGRERVRLAAQRIQRATGLDVDIALGASTAPQEIVLPAGRFGRPALRLTEDWTKKGVAVRILAAVDRKSLILFVLILIVCALFVANAASAAVRSRRVELGVLACLGWSTPRLFAVVLAEVGAIGLAAGVLGAVLALPVAELAGLPGSLARAALAIPAAVLLALLAGIVPAWRAARSEPIAAVRPVVLDARRARRPRSVARLALVNVWRAPGRSVLGAASLAIGVCALTLLLAATIAFRDVLVGTLLGDALSVQIRGSDYVAVGATILLGVGAVADVLYISVRERAAELATLQATGWDDRALARLIGCEGLMIGLAGSLAGSALGLAGAAAFAGSFPPALAITSAGAVIAGTLLGAAAALVPAASVRRSPPLLLLAGD